MLMYMYMQGRAAGSIRGRANTPGQAPEASNGQGIGEGVLGSQWEWPGGRGNRGMGRACLEGAGLVREDVGDLGGA